MVHCAESSRGGSNEGLLLRHFGKDLPLLAQYLVRVINKSLESGVCPDSWKLSTVVPLSKVPKFMELRETSPVVNLSHRAKMFDHIMMLQIYEYLEDASLIAPMQSAFQRGFSAQLALLRVTDDVRLGMDHGLVMISVYFDF
ncbi:uncharacterized protein LOC106637940 [Copidosoma floridanum]|uniref:uncharacterized protein LOC106637940 n=1 Tax=Copidosoma floridanum TaxID=29053 RepID=UPI0006C9A0AC|nr:uncharacterized protein LOC106637940 [Copidosoma floridanum]